MVAGGTQTFNTDQAAVVKDLAANTLFGHFFVLLFLLFTVFLSKITIRPARQKRGKQPLLINWHVYKHTPINSRKGANLKSS